MDQADGVCGTDNVDRYLAYTARRSIACPNDPPPLFQEANRFVGTSFMFLGRFD